MIPNISLKKLSKLLRGVISKHHHNFCCLNCLLSFATKKQTYEKVCKNNHFSGIVMQSEMDNILKFNQYMKSNKTPFIIYADLECYR